MYQANFYVPQSVDAALNKNKSFQLSKSLFKMALVPLGDFLDMTPGLGL